MRRSSRPNDALATLVLLIGLAGCGDPAVEHDALAEALETIAESAGPPAPDPFVRDDQGRALILHGVNASGTAKYDPLRLPWYNRDDVRRMAREWGFNFARFLILWDGLEPEPGQIDEAYLDRIEERVDLLWSGGIRVMLDLHQDLWSIRFGGDGAPDWAIRDDGQPFEPQDQWFENYLQPAVKRCFDNFWAYDQGAHADLQEHYAAAWVAVATRFRDHPGVLGYDLMNEPHPGSAMDPIELLGLRPNPDGPHAAFDRDHFGPFYQRLIDAVRQTDLDKWVFFEPRYGAPGLGMPSYLGPLTDPRPGEARIAYAPHLYSLKAEATGVYDPIGDPAVANWERERQIELARQPMPLLLGEWGFSHETVNADGYLSDVLTMADRNLASWAWWSYDCGGWGFWECDGAERPMVAAVVRAYPQRVAGVPTAFSFDPDTRELVLTYADAPGVRGPTEIVAPARLYPTGVSVSLPAAPDGAAWAWDEARGLVTVTLANTGETHEIRVGPADGVAAY